MKYILKLTIILCLFVVYMAGNVYASLSLDKTYILLDSTKRNEDIKVFNRANEARTYNVSFIHYRQNSDGSYSRVEKETANLKFVDDLLVYTPRTFTIEKDGTQVIRIQRKSLANVEDGEYMSHMLIQEVDIVNEQDEIRALQKAQNKQLSIEIKPLYAFSFPVIVRKGNLDYENSIQNIQKSVIEDKETLIVDITRIGNSSSRGTLEVYYQDQLVSDSSTFNILIGNNLRSMSLNLNTEKIKQLKKGNQSIELKVVYTDQATNKKYEKPFIYQ